MNIVVAIEFGVAELLCNMPVINTPTMTAPRTPRSNWNTCATNRLSLCPLKSIGIVTAIAPIYWCKGAKTGWLSGTTLPPPGICSDPLAIAAASCARYGQPAEQVEAELRHVLGWDTPTVHQTTPRNSGISGRHQSKRTLVARLKRPNPHRKKYSLTWLPNDQSQDLSRIRASP